MADASPPKWHLAHTTWFFETFILQPHLVDHRACDPRWSYQFNSYYDAVGGRHPRPEQGLLSRPTTKQVLRWRRDVDEALGQLLHDPPTGVLPLVELGLHHEQQHQELLLMDLLTPSIDSPSSDLQRRLDLTALPWGPTGCAVMAAWCRSEPTAAFLTTKGRAIGSGSALRAQQ